jgi:Trypsin-like peptidase domain
MFRAKMPDGSVVDAEWGYGPIEDSARIISQLEPRIVSVWALDDRSAQAHRLGSGFKVANANGSDGKHYAFVATCEHVIASALQILDIDSYKRRAQLFSPPLAKLLSPHLERGAIHVAVHNRNGAASMPVQAVSFNERADLCLLRVLVPQISVGDAIIAINSDPLTVDTRVLNVGFSLTGDDGPYPISSDRTFSVTAGLDLRMGRIVAVEEKLRHKPVFGYETNIPVPPGVSGGALFAFDDNLLTSLAVAGICMSDSNVQESARNILVSGASYAVGSQNLYGVIDPDTVRIKEWQLARPGESASFPFGTYFQDLEKLTGQLSISHDPDNETFVVRRRPS